MDVNLRPLLENRLPRNPKIHGQIQIIDDQKNYVEIQLEGKEQIFELSDILADIVIENLQIRFIMSELLHHHSYIDDKDQCEILVNTLKKLWYGGAKDNLEYVKKDVSNRIAVCLLEDKKHFLSLDGVIRFRMKDAVALWRDSLEDSVDEYLVESERKEFVRLLRYFVSMREPLIKYVKVRLGQKDYQMLDEQDLQVSVLLPGTEEDGSEITKEDLLLSQLINLSPEVIDLCEVKDEKLKGLLGQVFIGRVRC